MSESSFVHSKREAEREQRGNGIEKSVNIEMYAINIMCGVEKASPVRQRQTDAARNEK